MALYWGVTPMHIGRMENTDDLIVAVERMLLSQQRAKPGDELLILMGTPIATGAETNLIKFHKVSNASEFGADFPQSRW
jgi:pyruvate kinase